MALPSNMAVDLAASFRPKRSKSNHPLPGSPLSLYPEVYYLIIRLPNSEFLKMFCRLLLLALFVASLPWMTSFTGSPASTITQPISSDSANLDQLLSLFFRDLTNEGLIKKTSLKAVFLSNGNEENLKTLTDYNMDTISLNDLEKQSSVLDGTVDFIFTFNFPAASQFIDRTLKTGGVTTVLLTYNPSAAFYKPLNYKIAYMRRFDLIAVALWKTVVSGTNFPTQRKLLCGDASEAKKAALQKLEDVLLEPPRAASGKSSRYLKRTRYLPDLMGDSLENYPRRVFIDVGLPEKDGGSRTDWFPRHYPTRNKDFEIYKIETVTEDSSGKEVPQIGMSDWLSKNVKDEEYVVMKAEAEVVEEMVRSKAIRLVDELFLECKPQLGHGRKQGSNEGNMRSRRAYWECLALYGKLRDEGVAVHQWWG